MTASLNILSEEHVLGNVFSLFIYLLFINYCFFAFVVCCVIGML